jgi:hypothetical protein
MIAWSFSLTFGMSSMWMPGISTPCRLVRKISPLPYSSAISTMRAMLLALTSPPGTRTRLAVMPRSLLTRKAFFFIALTSTSCITAAS